jgi:hypothetical protein
MGPDSSGLRISPQETKRKKPGPSARHPFSDHDVMVVIYRLI